MSKRTNYLEWDEMFMMNAFLAAQRSKDPNTQVGAVLVDNNNHICGTGYNGMPNGTTDDRHWGKSEDNPWDIKYNFVVHAELNCILNSSNTKGSTMYVTLFPCNECAKAIVQAGITKVVYSEIRPGTNEEISRYILKNGGVKIVGYDGVQEIKLTATTYN